MAQRFQGLLPDVKPDAVAGQIAGRGEAEARVQGDASAFQGSASALQAGKIRGRNPRLQVRARGRMKQTGAQAAREREGGQ